ncbi:hypothetical protein IE53DRAFT_366785 [Violaceomyces palustris]|uniref:Uncharacterized protein n=1 Tax=Violaceomyces palustris TaxID=1673888 RepID=A0ACD0P4C7_9BASI|nr:hypothetical protein IE53DRAFT_366785 [Violaceomyces palustris]
MNADRRDTLPSKMEYASPNYYHHGHQRNFPTSLGPSDQRSPNSSGASTPSMHETARRRSDSYFASRDVGRPSSIAAPNEQYISEEARRAHDRPASWNSPEEGHYELMRSESNRNAKKRTRKLLTTEQSNVLYQLLEKVWFQNRRQVGKRKSFASLYEKEPSSSSSAMLGQGSSPYTLIDHNGGRDQMQRMENEQLHLHNQERGPMAQTGWREFSFSAGPKDLRSQGREGPSSYRASYSHPQSVDQRHLGQTDHESAESGQFSRRLSVQREGGPSHLAPRVATPSSSQHVPQPAYKNLAGLAAFACHDPAYKLKMEASSHRVSASASASSTSASCSSPGFDPDPRHSGPLTVSPRPLGGRLSAPNTAALSRGYGERSGYQTRPRSNTSGRDEANVTRYDPDPRSQEREQHSWQGVRAGKEPIRPRSGSLARRLERFVPYQPSHMPSAPRSAFEPTTYNAPLSPTSGLHPHPHSANETNRDRSSSDPSKEFDRPRRLEPLRPGSTEASSQPLPHHTGPLTLSSMVRSDSRGTSFSGSTTSLAISDTQSPQLSACASPHGPPLDHKEDAKFPSKGLQLPPIHQLQPIPPSIAMDGPRPRLPSISELRFNLSLSSRSEGESEDRRRGSVQLRQAGGSGEKSLWRRTSNDSVREEDSPMEAESGDGADYGAMSRREGSPSCRWSTNKTASVTRIQELCSP